MSFRSWVNPVEHLSLFFSDLECRASAYDLYSSFRHLLAKELEVEFAIKPVDSYYEPLVEKTRTTIVAELQELSHTIMDVPQEKKDLPITLVPVIKVRKSFYGQATSRPSTREV